jgi:hypothetical protein
MHPSIRSRLLALLRAQWAGLLALFLVLAGGTAYAANTIGSSDIINGQVKTADIGNNQVRSADVRDDALANGGLSGPDIKEETLDVVQGRGTLLSNRIVQVPTDPPEPLLDIPGLGQLRVNCDPGEADISHLNDTANSTIDAWLTGFDFFPPLAPGDGTDVANSNGPTSAMLTLGLGDDPGPRRIAVIHASVVKRSVGSAPCIFQAQGTLWTSD